MNGIDLYDGITLHQGDCRDIMRSLPADHFDAVITDPPYGISFAGEKWDTATPQGFQAWAQSWGEAALRVIKPGGYLLAFSAPRTYHRLTSGLEDAGFEIRDAMAWIRADGKPNGMDLSSAFDRAAGVLDQREGRDVREWADEATATHMSSHKLHATGAMNIRAGMDTVGGLYPPNLLMGEQAMATAVQQGAPDHVWPVFRYQPKAPSRERPIVGGVQHVTVKPLELMRYLVRLVVKPGSLILEPFAGSGTTLQAAAMENTRAVGCELDDRYIPLIKARFAQGIEAPLDLFGLDGDAA